MTCKNYMTAYSKAGVTEVSFEVTTAFLKLQRKTFVLLSRFNNYKSTHLSYIFPTTTYDNYHAAEFKKFTLLLTCSI